jgi:AcrR family transcriptional regulator
MPSHQSTGVATSSRNRLLNAAKKLFAAHGYEQTATSAIARAAATSESQLMRYFGGKAGVLEALFEEAWVDLNARVLRVLQQELRTRDAILEAVMTVALALARETDLGILFMFEGRRMRGNKAAVRLSTGFVSYSDTIRGLVRKAQAAGEMDPALDAGAIASSILGAAESMMRDRSEMRATLEAMLSGFKAAPKRKVSR